MQRNEYLLAFFLALLVVGGVGYEHWHGANQGAEVVITHHERTPFDETAPPAAANAIEAVTHTVASRPVPSSAQASPVLQFINHAEKDDFLQVPGIGEVYAERILQAREAARSFRQSRQVLDINGIGPATFKKLREHVTRLNARPTPPPALKRPKQPTFQPFHQPVTAHNTAQRIPLNRATQKQLMRVPGIGEQLSANILRDRRQQQGFQSWAQVDQVSGIGEKRLESLKEFFSLP